MKKEKSEVSHWSKLPNFFVKQQSMFMDSPTAKKLTDIANEKAEKLLKARDRH